MNSTAYEQAVTQIRPSNHNIDDHLPDYNDITHNDYIAHDYSASNDSEDDELLDNHSIHDDQGWC